MSWEICGIVKKQSKQKTAYRIIYLDQTLFSLIGSLLAHVLSPSFWGSLSRNKRTGGGENSPSLSLEAINKVITVRRTRAPCRFLPGALVPSTFLSCFSLQRQQTLHVFMFSYPRFMNNVYGCFRVTHTTEHERVV